QHRCGHVRMAVKRCGADMTKIFRTMIWSVLLTAGAGQSFAAPAPESGPSGTVQTSFVDLTNDGAARPAAAALPAPAGGGDANSGVAFIDLTQNASATTMPERGPARSRTPRTRLVDLTNGAAVPEASESDYDMDVVPDTIVITADRQNDPYEES